MKLLERLDDRVNPIVVKELRQAVQSRLVPVALLLFLAVQLLVLATIVLNREYQSGGALDFRAGPEIFRVQQLVLFGACFIFIPAYGGIRLGLERGDANADLLFISSLKPRSIAAGKLAALLVLTLLIFSTCAPFMTFTYLLRGLDIPTIVLTLGIDFVLVALAAQFALMLAVLPVYRWLKVIAAFLAAGLGLWILAGAAAIGHEIFGSGRGMPWDEPSFWGFLATLIGTALTVLGLMFVATVAMVSPPAANRAVAFRLYTVFLWSATAAIALTWAVKYAEPGPLIAWTVLLVALFCFYLVTAINEREAWGPRVARTIPRWLPFRLLAFLLFSGSAGGVAFSTLLLAMTLGASYCCAAELAGPRLPGVLTVIEAMLLVSLYVFNYAMAGALCRTWLLSRWVRPINTWVIAIVILGLGSAGPPLLVLMFANREYFATSSISWWFLANPFASIMALAENNFNWRSRYDVYCLMFVSGWAILTAVVALPWFSRQFRRFRRPVLTPLQNAASQPTTRPVAAVVLPSS